MTNLETREDHESECKMPYRYAYRVGDSKPFCQTYLKPGFYKAGRFDYLSLFNHEIDIEVKEFYFRKHKLFRRYMGVFISITNGPDIDEDEAYIDYDFE